MILTPALCCACASDGAGRQKALQCWIQSFLKSEVESLLNAQILLDLRHAATQPLQILCA